jgi:hypothetical protein
LTFAVEWRAAGIPLTTHEIDAGTVVEAAGRATVLFAEDDTNEPSHVGRPHYFSGIHAGLKPPGEGERPIDPTDVSEPG